MKLQSTNTLALARLPHCLVLTASTGADLLKGACLKNLYSIFIAVALYSTSSVAGVVTNGIPAFKAGRWIVYRDIDSMTDKVTCTGVYDGDASIQMADTALYVGLVGGISGIEVRYGNDKSEPMRLATDREKRIDRVIFENADFERAKTMGRLRIEVVTLIRGVVSKDIDMSDAISVFENISMGCPGQISARDKNMKKK